jgi:hypothetical protein
MSLIRECWGVKTLLEVINRILRKTSPPIRQYSPAGSHSIPQAKDTMFHNHPRFTYRNWYLQNWFTKMLR